MNTAMNIANVFFLAMNKEHGFSIGEYVLYVPDHAEGALTHKDVEPGIVTGKNRTYIFVRFGGDASSKACLPRQLY